jgi:S-adenosylmethionine hydrolase
MKRKNPPTKRPKNRLSGLIALLTDFGSGDHYVGTMKGVILSMNPDARIVDISHDVSPHNTQEAGYLLWASYKHFPDNTVFVNVVDPGVGSNRKIICVVTPRHKFIAPDNGLLNLVILEENIRRSYEILQPPQFSGRPVSATFHGRDIFAPLAGSLSLGAPPSQFGVPFNIDKPLPVFYSPDNGAPKAKILHIDRFGNLVTNIPGKFFDRCSVGVGTTKIGLHVRNFAEATANHPALIVGSSDLIEVVLKEGSAAEVLRADLRTVVIVLGIT